MSENEREERGQAYNYERFSLDMVEGEEKSWQKNGVDVGDPAPDFTLPALDGDKVTLSDLRGGPVVLEFGSSTCDVFCHWNSQMNSLASEFTDATFLVVYTQEAHPGELTGSHRSIDEKKRRAGEMVSEEEVDRRVLIDDLEGTVHRTYGGGWNPVYVIDSEGFVALRMFWNDPSTVRRVLEDLSSGDLESPIQEVGTPTVDREETMRAVLGRGGLRALLDYHRETSS